MSTMQSERPVAKVSDEFLGAIQDLAGAALKPALSRIPVDATDLSFAFLRVTTRVNDGEATAFDSGVPKLRADIEVTRDGFTSAPIKINLAEDYCRQFLNSDRYTLTAGQAVELEGLAVFPWETGGRTGMSFSCDAIRPASVSGGRKSKGSTAASSYVAPSAEVSAA